MDFEMGTTRRRLICKHAFPARMGVLSRLLVEEQVESSPLGKKPRILRKRGKQVPSVSSRESAA